MSRTVLFVLSLGLLMQQCILARKVEERTNFKGQDWREVEAVVRDISDDWVDTPASRFHKPERHIVSPTLEQLLSADSQRCAHPERQGENLRPVIGIATQPMFSVEQEMHAIFGDEERDFEEDNAAADARPPYIAASYVKMVEAAGARPAVIFHNASDEELERAVMRVNAVLFPGGAGRLRKDSPYYQLGKRVLRIAEHVNAQGDHFSLHFTCLGFQLLLSEVSGQDLLRSTDANNLPVRLLMNASEVKHSRLFAKRGVIDGQAHAELLGDEEPLAMHYNEWGVHREDFDGNRVLNSYFRVLSTSMDRRGLEFVSTVEAKHFPFFGTQWHPEKNGFEWSLTAKTPHSSSAVAVSNFFAQHMGWEARRNFHRFESEAELTSSLVYSVPAVFTARDGGHFEELYVFE